MRNYMAYVNMATAPRVLLPPPPILSGIEVVQHVSPSQILADIVVPTTGYSGTIYLTIDTSGAGLPTRDQIIAGKTASGAAAYWAGRVSAYATDVYAPGPGAIPANTTMSFYAVHMDAPGNPSPIRSLALTTDHTIASYFGTDPLKGYYNFSNITKLFKDTAGTIPCTAIGDQIARINPEYGGFPFISQTTATKRPTLQKDAGGRWFALFDVDDIMASTFTLTVAPDHFIAAAVERSAQVNLDAVVGVGLSITNSHKVAGNTTLFRLSGMTRLPTTQNSVNSPANTFPLNTQYVASSLATGTAVTIRKDLDTPTTLTFTAGSFLSTAACQVTMGANTASPSKTYGICISRGAPDTITQAHRDLMIKGLASLQGRIL